MIKRVKTNFSFFNNLKYVFLMMYENNKLLFFLESLFIIISVSIAFCGVYLPRLVTSAVLNYSGNLFNTLLPIIGLGLILIILNSLSAFISNYNSELYYNLRTSGIYKHSEKTINTDYENIENAVCRNLMVRSGELFSGSGGVSTFEKIAKGAFTLINNIVCFFMFGIITSFIGFYLPFILIVTCFFSYMILKKADEFVFVNRERASKIDRKLNYTAHVSSSFDSAKDIRMFNMRGMLIHIYDKAVKERLKLEKAFLCRYVLIDIFSVLVVLIRNSFAYVILIYMFSKGKITIPEFVLYFGSITAFSSRVNSIFINFSELKNNSLLLSDLRAYFNYPESTNRSESEYKLISDKGCNIELMNVSYQYPGADDVAINDVSLQITAGEKIAIVGLNGAGKTTLIKLICGLYKPTSGHIYINGIDQSEYNIFDYFSYIATVFQDFHFLPVSIAETVSCNDINPDMDKIMECLILVGLDEKVSALEDGINTKLNKIINENGIELSGGEQQKLLIARAIYKNCNIIILDEPSSSLDSIAESNLYLKYNDLSKNKTSLFISHRLASTKFCSKIFFVKDGKITETGSHDELMAYNGEYKNLFEIQRRYYIDEGVAQ
jgi:ABC-type multidrug transport system fused ATPase/permease subunit